MVKVITYGTYDLLHHGHIRLLERAKGLGDYLIVGVTADDFDKTRGKINVQQSLMERIEGVRDTGLADEIIVEEYEGQKIDDIKRYGVDIFTVGSDWVGKFDYLNEYCKVVYLERTEGVSSSEIRKQNRSFRLGLTGETQFLNKVMKEAVYVNGMHISGLCTVRREAMDVKFYKGAVITGSFDEMLEHADAVYIRSFPEHHKNHIRKALERGKHVLCESPVTLSAKETQELFGLAADKGLILMEAIKTAYATAYARLLLLVKGGKIGEIVSVDATCTSLKVDEGVECVDWNGIYEWGPTALLPVFQILGTQYRDCRMVTRYRDKEQKRDAFTKIDFRYDHAVGTVKVGDGVKSEGELIISGTKGYVYVPAPWWKTDYFEIRYENPADNRRYFYQLDGEGIRYELVAFARAIARGAKVSDIEGNVTYKIAEMMEMFAGRKNMVI
ncbi:MAG: adenylyltransferase/cytidyltransferase family protein [Dorea sp.]|jgi:choline-phosphate cytidylyltransferase|nr:adenylyltransferase/cytidyltransferase family protein [Dorea sp.]